jgi:Flp pilus assembly pilin Flp
MAITTRSTKLGKPEIQASRRANALRAAELTAAGSPERSCNIVPGRNKLPKRNFPFGDLGVALRLEERGAVMAEYVVLLGLIAIGGALGLWAIGVAVATNFQFVRSILLSPIP